MELAPPDKYLSDDVPKSKNGDKVWREQDLPILPQKWLNGVKSDCKKQFKLLGSLLKKCTAVVKLRRSGSRKVSSLSMKC